MLEFKENIKSKQKVQQEKLQKLTLAFSAKNIHSIQLPIEEKPLNNAFLKDNLNQKEYLCKYDQLKKCYVSLYNTILKEIKSPQCIKDQLIKAKTLSLGDFDSVLIDKNKGTHKKNLNSDKKFDYIISKIKDVNYAVLSFCLEKRKFNKASITRLKFNQIQDKNSTR